uniref:Uncharacterized protein n=1 Tax=Rhizophora mucronata TaxID=61149 RepID=A0A2P2QVK9_RHIMU
MQQLFISTTLHSSTCPNKGSYKVDYILLVQTIQTDSCSLVIQPCHISITDYIEHWMQTDYDPIVITAFS